MTGLDWNIVDAFVDNVADRFVNNFVPGNGMFLFLELIRTFLIYSGVLQTGVDQWFNNDINRHFSEDRYEIADNKSILSFDKDILFTIITYSLH